MTADRLNPINNGVTAQKTDEECLVVYEMLCKAYAEVTDSYGPVGNIFGVFFHDLMINITGTIIHRNTYRSYPGSIEFPFVNRDYALKPYDIDESLFFLKQKNWNDLSRIKRSSLLPIALGNAIPRDRRFGGLANKFLTLLGEFQPFTRVHLPGRTDQIDQLLCQVQEICRKFDFQGCETVVENWRKFVGFHTRSDQIKEKTKGILVGTRCDLQNRKLAVNFLQQSKEVIAFTHGEIANSVFDEPVYGYAERSLCSTLVDYGQVVTADHRYQSQIDPVLKLQRTSVLVNSYYKRSQSICRKYSAGERLLYIPTLYSGNHMYGPFRNHEDCLYQQWQQALSDSIPGLTVKVHPKSRTCYRIGGPVELGALESVAGLYDGLILDYYSTAATIALFSEKPIIFFDLGLRRLTRKFKDAVRKRVFYWKVDLTRSFKDQIHAGMDAYKEADTQWSNLHLERLAICDTDNETLFNACRRLIR